MGRQRWTRAFWGQVALMASALLVLTVGAGACLFDDDAASRDLCGSQVSPFALALFAGLLVSGSLSVFPPPSFLLVSSDLPDPPDPPPKSPFLA
jgi:hypothetical protein